MGKTTNSKKIEAVSIAYAAPDLNRDSHLLGQVAKYFAQEIRKRRIEAIKENGK